MWGELSWGVFSLGRVVLGRVVAVMLISCYLKRSSAVFLHKYYRGDSTRASREAK